MHLIRLMTGNNYVQIRQQQHNQLSRQQRKRLDPEYLQSGI